MDPIAKQQTEAHYSVAKAAGKIDWDRIPSLSVSNVLWTEDTGVRAWGQLCFDGENLYVRLRASEKQIRAEYTRPLSPVHEDSCLEFFFKSGNSDNYFNFEINPNGCLRIQFGPDRMDRVDLVRNDAREFFDIRTDRTADGWEVFYRIPLKFIRIFEPDFRFEGGFCANFYKCGDKTVIPHYLSWAPVHTEAPDFHRPEYFGSMAFD